MDAQALAFLDQTPPEILDAIAHVKAPPQASLATPHAFLTTSGMTYWVKAQSQFGLETELIAGRLAARMNAGPASAIVRVAPQALPADGSAAHLRGVVVGTVDIPGAINNRELALLGISVLDPAVIDPFQRAVVVTFQTWIGLDDLQVLIDMTSGRIASHDHGGCFGDVSTSGVPALALLDLPGLDRAHGSYAGHVAAAVARVESISDDELLESVARVPNAPGWNVDAVRRLQIAEWLAHRRDRIAKAMKTW